MFSERRGEVVILIPVILVSKMTTYIGSDKVTALILRMTCEMPTNRDADGEGLKMKVFSVSK